MLAQIKTDQMDNLGSMWAQLQPFISSTGEYCGRAVEPRVGPKHTTLAGVEEEYYDENSK